jgi:hypothetical protein
MDHLPLPRNPAFPPLEIPYVCLEDYDGGSFMDYPQRLSVRREGVENISFTQNWLFFGLLGETFGRRSAENKVEGLIAVSTRDLCRDFVRLNENGSPVLTTSKLADYTSIWLRRMQLASDEN